MIIDHRYLDREDLERLFPLYNHSVEQPSYCDDYNMLIEAGLVTSKERGERKYFKITDDGKKVLDDIVDRFTERVSDRRSNSTPRPSDSASKEGA